MKKPLIAVLLGLAALSISMASYAGYPSHPQSPKPVQVNVTVAGLACQPCIDQLQQELTKLPGVTAVNITGDPSQVTARLDETKMSVSHFVNVTAAYLSDPDEQISYRPQWMLYVDTPSCADKKVMGEKDKTEIPSRLKSVKGIDTVTLDASGKVVSITFLPDANVKTTDIAHALYHSSLRIAMSFASPAQATKIARTQSHRGADVCR